MRYQAELSKKPDGVDWQAIFSGILFTFLTSLVIAGVLAVSVYFSGLTDAGIRTWLYFAGMLSVLLGGGFAGKQAGKAGWLHGGVSGTSYVLLALLFSLASAPDSWELLASLQQLAVAFIIGSVGGALGVNYR